MSQHEKHNVCIRELQWNVSILKSTVRTLRIMLIPSHWSTENDATVTHFTSAGAQGRKIITINQWGRATLPGDVYWLPQDHQMLCLKSPRTYLANQLDTSGWPYPNPMHTKKHTCTHLTQSYTCTPHTLQVTRPIVPDAVVPSGTGTPFLIWVLALEGKIKALNVCCSVRLPCTSQWRCLHDLPAF